MELKEENDQNNFISDHESDSEKWNFPSQIEDSYLNYKTDDAPTNSVVGSIEGSATGMLIVDAGSPSRRSVQVDALSYPDSIPTEIMSLDGERYNKNVVDNLSSKSKNTITTTSAMNDNDQSSGKKRLLLLQVASVIIFSLMTINGYLLWHHGELQQHHEKLETQIDDLLKEVNEMKHAPTQLVATTNNDNVIGSNNDSPKFALFDNCWFKAEIEIGNCLNDIKECWYDIASNAYSAWNTIFEENKKDNDADYNTTNDNNNNNNAITILQADWNTMFVETSDTIANVTASLFDSILYSKNTMEESFWNATQSIEESLWYATEQVRDIIQDASIYSQL